MRLAMALMVLAFAEMATAQTIVDGSGNRIPRKQLAAAMQILSYELDGYTDVQVRNLVRSSEPNFYCGYVSAVDENKNRSKFERFMFFDRTVVVPKPSGDERSNSVLRLMVSQKC